MSRLQVGYVQLALFCLYNTSMVHVDMMRIIHLGRDNWSAYENNAEDNQSLCQQTFNLIMPRLRTTIFFED